MTLVALGKSSGNNTGSSNYYLPTPGVPFGGVVPPPPPELVLPTSWGDLESDLTYEVYLGSVGVELWVLIAGAIVLAIVLMAVL